MFFSPRLNRERKGGNIAFTADTEIVIPKIKAADHIKKTVNTQLLSDCNNSTACKKLTFSVGFPDEIKAKIEKHTRMSGNDEEYAVLVGEETFVCAKKEEGLIFGLSTLLHLLDAGELSARLIYDYPVCSVRGYRVYMPGRENIGIFKDMIDLLAYYKYNAIILEIGGAMEYKKHPEINEKWVEACAEAHRYSGRAQEIQKQTHPWEKNSIHCDNGDGSYLTQDECRDIAEYCRNRGLEVIPECPTLSHSDYMVMAHPELSERDVLINGVMGLCGESGEVIDIVKKWLAQGHELNREQLIKELGDVAWYLAEAATALDVPLEDILQANIEKLKKRYPEGFDIERSTSRCKDDIEK